MISTFAAWRRRRATVRELSHLSDRQLADIGVERSDIAEAVLFASNATSGGGVPTARHPVKLARPSADPIFDESYEASALPSRA